MTTANDTKNELKTTKKDVNIDVEENKAINLDPISVKFSNLKVTVKVRNPENKGYQNILSIFGISNTTIPRDILRGISGTIKPASLVAIMGASGAGKSTLLNCLSLRINYSNGELLYSDKVPSKHYVKSKSVYVQQSDLFLEKLTVKRHLDYQLSLRLKESSSSERYKLTKQFVIDVAHLQKCLNTKIGGQESIGISSGERKRLNIASELISMPPLMFVDEPTTNLDSHRAKYVMETLKYLVKKGITVISTIHLPSKKIYDLFDQVILLSEGRIIYSGDRLGCVYWLERLGEKLPPFVNPADFIISVVSIPKTPQEREIKLKKIEEWADRWEADGEAFLKEWEMTEREKVVNNILKDTENYMKAANIHEEEIKKFLKVESDLLNSSGTSVLDKRLEEIKQQSNQQNSLVKSRKLPGCGWWFQLQALLSRAFISDVFNKELVIARIVGNVVNALILGLIFFRVGKKSTDVNSGLSALFAIVMHFASSSTYTTNALFIKEFPILRREYESNLYFLPIYLAAKLIANILAVYVFQTLFFLICTLLMDLVNVRDFFYLSLISLFLYLVASSYGAFTACIANNEITGSSLASVIVLPLMLFSGFFVSLDRATGLGWLRHISHFFHGLIIFAGVVLPKRFPGADSLLSQLGIDISKYYLHLPYFVYLTLGAGSLFIFSLYIKLTFFKENE